MSSFCARIGEHRRAPSLGFSVATIAARIGERQTFSMDGHIRTLRHRDVRLTPTGREWTCFSSQHITRNGVDGDAYSAVVQVVSDDVESLTRGGWLLDFIVFSTAKMIPHSSYCKCIVPKNEGPVLKGLRRKKCRKH